MPSTALLDRSGRDINLGRTTMQQLVVPDFLVKDITGRLTFPRRYDSFGKGYDLHFKQPVTLSGSRGCTSERILDGSMLVAVCEEALTRIQGELRERADSRNIQRGSQELHGLMLQAELVEDLFSAIAKHVSHPETVKDLFRVEMPAFRAATIASALLVLRYSQEQDSISHAAGLIAKTLLRDSHVNHSSAAKSIQTRAREFASLLDRQFPQDAPEREAHSRLIREALRERRGSLKKPPTIENLAYLGRIFGCF